MSVPVTAPSVQEPSNHQQEPARASSSRANARPADVPPTSSLPQQAVSHARASRPAQASTTQAKDEPLSPEAMVALVERLLGRPYDAAARARQLAAARSLLAMKLVADLSTLERVYAACYDDWWHQHYGPMHLTHLLEREKSGQPRIARLLARITAGRAPQHASAAPASAQAEGGSQPDQYAAFIALRRAEQRAWYEAYCRQQAAVGSTALTSA